MPLSVVSSEPTVVAVVAAALDYSKYNLVAEKALAGAEDAAAEPAGCILDSPESSVEMLDHSGREHN